MSKLSKINLPVVLVVATLCGAAMVLFFVDRGRHAEPVVEETADTIVEEPFDEIGYYEQEADEFIRMLPSDKRVLARMVDSVNHNIVYIESGSRPSCYSYDLESHATDVLFGGSDGFYIGTKLLMLGAVKDWRRVGDRVVFIAENNAPDVEYPSSYEVFSMDLYTHGMQVVDCCAGAYFSDSTHLTIITAHYLYRKLFTDEPVYTETSHVRAL